MVVHQWTIGLCWLLVAPLAGCNAAGTSKVVGGRLDSTDTSVATATDVSAPVALPHPPLASPPKAAAAQSAPPPAVPSLIPTPTSTPAPKADAGPHLQPGSRSWRFTDAADYTFDSTVISVGGGAARLRVSAATDADGSAAGFGGGTGHNVAWDSANAWCAPGAYQERELPDNGAMTAGIDMSGNVLLLHLNEGAPGGGPAGSDFRDFSGGTNHAVAVGAASLLFAAPGRIGAGLTFAGGGGRLAIPDAASLRINSAMSFALWMRTTSSNPLELISKAPVGGSAAPFEFVAFTTGSGDVRFLTSQCDNSSYQDVTTAGLQINDGTWHHIAGTAGAAGIKLYVDGQPAATSTAVGPGAPCSGAATVNVGASTYGSRQEFVGTLDEVALWGRVLTDQQISALYQWATPTFASRVMDARGAVPWTSLAWTPAAPYRKPLPDQHAGLESGYRSGAVSMAGNVALFHFDAPGAVDGATVADTAGFGLSGVLHTAAGGGSKTVPGLFGAALTFDGAHDYITVPTTADLDVTTQGSICTWVKTLDTVSLLPFFGRGDASQRWYFYYDNPAKSLVLGSLTGGSYSYATGVAALSTSDWHHVCGVLDATQAVDQDKIRLYFDGAEIAGGSKAVTWTNGFGSAATTTYIGRGTSSTATFYGAETLDELAIWTRPLSPLEVQDMYRRSTALQVQVRTCSQPDCGDGVFVGPDGTGASYFSEATNAGAGTPQTTLAGVAANRYAQYRLIFGPDLRPVPPRLLTVTLGPAHADPTAPALTTATGVPYAALTAFTATVDGAGAGTAAFQLSNDGAAWYYFDGSRWSPAGNAAAVNTAAAVSDHIAAFATDVGSGSLFVRAFLQSAQGLPAVGLTALDVTYLH